jgi:hypothetical protein
MVERSVIHPIADRARPAGTSHAHKPTRNRALDIFDASLFEAFRADRQSVSTVVGTLGRAPFVQEAIQECGRLPGEGARNKTWRLGVVYSDFAKLRPVSRLTL